MLKKKLVGVSFLACLVPASAFALGNFVITEAMIAPGAGPEWFELRNERNFTQNIVDYRVNSTFVFSTAATLNGVTSLLAGEVAVFIRSADSTADIAAFRTAWDIPLSVKIGHYSTSISFVDGGSGTGPSSNPVTAFNSQGSQVDQRIYDAATGGTTWTYRPSTQKLEILSAVGEYGAYAATTGEIGSPGVFTTVMAIPEPATAGVLVGLLGLGLAGARRSRLLHNS